MASGEEELEDWDNPNIKEDVEGESPGSLLASFQIVRPRALELLGIYQIGIPAT
jgi:hypothetical protein